MIATSDTGRTEMDFLRGIRDRFQRLTLTVISKSWLVFFIGTYLLILKLITPEVWLLLAGTVIGVNTFQKLKGVENVRSGKPD